MNNAEYMLEMVKKSQSSEVQDREGMEVGHDPLRSWVSESLDFETMIITGRVEKVIGLSIECSGLNLPLGALCSVQGTGHDPIDAEVVGLRDDRVLLMPYQDLYGIKSGDAVVVQSLRPTIPVSPQLLGCVVNAWGRPLGRRSNHPLPAAERLPLHRSVINPLDRKPMEQVLRTHVRALDAFLTTARGQRLGIFSGSGVGKSMLMGMITRFCEAPVVVVALVGERGREVNDFLEHSLGKEGLKKSVVVVATSEESPLMRLKAPFTATTIAEYFCQQGKDVVLLLDSLTRVAYAQREVGLTIGEPPAMKAYPPSLPNLFSRLLERAGLFQTGSITGFYTVLVEADDINEPVSDIARSILDGHLWLSRDMAHRGIFPAIDVLSSISRLMVHVAQGDHQSAAQKVRSLLARYRDMEDLINIGAYQKGSQSLVDEAIQKMPDLIDFLKQDFRTPSPWEETLSRLKTLAA